MAAKSSAKLQAPRKPQTEPVQIGIPFGLASATKLDRLIHERLRLGILSALAAEKSMTFSELKNLLGPTDGNLSVHARKLEDANYIACEKGFEGRVPRSEYRITPAGRKALEKYLDHMETLIRVARESI